MDYLVIRFACEGDREAALMNGPWMVAGQLFVMEQWRPNFFPSSGEVGRVVVWLRLPHLPLEYWEKSTILQIASKAGKPLALDNFTDQGKRLGFARDKIEVDFKSPVRPGIFVKGRTEGSKEKFWQVFIYENLSAFCCRCGRIGHVEAACISSSPAAVMAETVEVRKEGANGAGKSPSGVTGKKPREEGDRVRSGP
ncbi:uncharacterized protein LOC103698628 [Phoenix dactylifera]|uniref:Uncharacterized protein LOC103698628 n=1 Tax=Phoenix dactylifera TaxID=42345 RepID=A0A8B7BJY1_PHODC|nr:uncharacterized protein LOC103698628 [Phoenix dactylifera]